MPPSVEVVRARALPARAARRLGVGDLGLRSLVGLAYAAEELLSRERYDLVYVTIYPTYPALLAPLWRARFSVPYVLDYQDPWVSEWGRSVGPAAGGRADVRSRLSRAAALALEPIAVRDASGLTAVSAATFEAVKARVPEARRLPALELPIGGEPADFEAVRRDGRPNGIFDPADALFHAVYVGTLLPRGVETLRALFRAVARLRANEDPVVRRLRLHFVGTSNETRDDAPERVLPVARAEGVADVVTERAPRVGYVDALRLLVQASAVLVLGSDEPHYTASKLYPALLSGRPLFAAFLEASPAVAAIRAAAPDAHVVTYSASMPATERVAELADALAALLRDPVPCRREGAALAAFSAEALAAGLAGFLAERVRPRG